MQRTLWNRTATFLVWLLAAASVVYWALQFVRGPVAPLSAAVAAPTQGLVDAQALAKGLGGGSVTARDASLEAAPAAPSIFQAARFVLTGVVVNRGQAAPSVALIGVDGKPPRPYRVGASLADGIVLHSVSAGKAMLAASSDAPVGLTLELPLLTSAVAGTAIASRPPMPAIPAPLPRANPSANPVTNPMEVTGPRVERLGANREREADRAKDRIADRAQRRQDSTSRKSPQDSAPAP
jgi:general secretion pathway protein C